MRIRMKRPPRRRTPTGTPKPTGTSQRLGLTRAELQKQKQRPTATSAGPTAAQKAKLVASLKAAKEKKAIPTAIPTAKPDPRIRKKPTGTPKPTGGIRGATQAQLRQIRQRQQSAKPPTSAQRAAMRKQAKARFGNTATRRRNQDAAAKRAVRRGDATPGQVRSFKQMRQKAAQGKFAPKRTTKRTSRRLV